MITRKRVSRVIQGLIGLCGLVIVTLRPQTSAVKTIMTDSGETSAASDSITKKAAPFILNSTLSLSQNGNKNDGGIDKTISEESSSPPRLFTCGFDLWNLSSQLFGDLELAGRFG